MATDEQACIPLEWVAFARGRTSAWAGVYCIAYGVRLKRTAPMPRLRVNMAVNRAPVLILDLHAALCYLVRTKPYIDRSLKLLPNGGAKYLRD